MHIHTAFTIHCCKQAVTNADALFFLDFQTLISEMHKVIYSGITEDIWNDLLLNGDNCLSISKDTFNIQ